MHAFNEDTTSPEYTRDRGQAVLYNHVREYPRPVYHQVRLYASYTRAHGCGGELLLHVEGTIRACLNEMKLWPISKEQVARVHQLMSQREDGIIDSELKFHRY